MDRQPHRPARRSRTAGLLFAGLVLPGILPQSSAREPLPVPRADQREPLIVPDIAVPGETADSPSDSALEAEGATTWGRLLRELSEEVLPGDYEVRRDWGSTTEVFAGFNVRRNNGLPRISKRTRRVNHGLWRRFRVALVRPEDRLSIRFRNVRLAETGGLAGEIVLTARLRCTADAVSWNYGVRGPSITVLTDVTLHAVSDWRVYLRADEPDAWIADYTLVPEIRSVRLRILDFDVRRVGHIGGEVADELGDASRDIVAELLERQQPRILRRLQRATGQLNAPSLPASGFEATD